MSSFPQTKIKQQAKTISELLATACFCPVHQDQKPAVIGPFEKTGMLSEMIFAYPHEEFEKLGFAFDHWEDYDLNFLCKKKDAEWIMEHTFPEVMIFPSIEWTCFCPQCAVKNPFAWNDGKRNYFGYGYTSQDTWRRAISHWNTGCHRYIKAEIMRSMKGDNRVLCL